MLDEDQLLDNAQAFVSGYFTFLEHADNTPAQLHAFV